MSDLLHETMPTGTLLGRAADGDDRARDALCTRYRRPLLEFARGRLPRAARGLLETEDLVQEVMARSMERLDGFQQQHSGGFLFYLRRAVVNAVIDAHRRHGGRPEQVDLPEEIEGEDAGPLGAVLRKEELEIYEAALASLDPGDQDLIVSRIELQQSYRQIAIELGRPSEDAARMAVKRAIARLAEEMQRQRGERSV